MPETILTPDQLNTLLNAWPEGTRGYDQDREAIRHLDMLGSRIGYGALAQIARWLYEVQCHGDTRNAAALKRERFASFGWPLPPNFDAVADSLRR